MRTSIAVLLALGGCAAPDDRPWRNGGGVPIVPSSITFANSTIGTP